MDGHSKIKNMLLSVTFALLGVAVIVLLFPLASNSATSQSTPSLNQFQLLEGKVELLQTVNDKLMQSVYWTLATLAAIFLGLISVNLYFNISANKREIEKLREDVEKHAKNLIGVSEAEIIKSSSAMIEREIDRAREEISNITTSAIKTSEAEITEKTSMLTNREIEKTIANALNMMRNELLIYQAEITKRFEEVDKKIVSINAAIEKTAGELVGMRINLKEVTTFKYSQQGKMGAVIGQIELLEHDIDNRAWNLKYRLEELRDELTGTYISAQQAEKIRKALSRIKNPEHVDAVKAVEAQIKVKPSGGAK